MNVSTPMLVTFIIYALGMILIGCIAFNSTKNFKDYILGGRNIGSLVTALSTGASDMSGWLLMGLPGAIYLLGISQSWIAIGLSIGAWVNWKVVAGRLRVQTEYYNNALTIPDFLSSRFQDNSKILRIISAVVILFFFTIYCSSGILAGSHLFESAFGLSFQSALWLGAATTIAYTLLGGFLAVSWTDTIQASLMLFALIITPIMVIMSLGNISDALEVIRIKNIANVKLLAGLNFLTVVSLMSWGLGYFGQPHILVRFMAAHSHRSIRVARHIGIIWMILCLAGAIAVGFFGIAYFQYHPDQAAGVQINNERVFIELAKILFNPWISGIILSAILAAIMSTLSCQLLVCSSTLTEDLYKGFVRKNASQKELVWIGRLMVLIIALIAIILAVKSKEQILFLVGYAWAGFGASFGPVILFSICWKRMTHNGALAGIVTGALTVLFWKPYHFFNVYEMIPGFIFSSIAIVITSFLGSPPSQEVQQRFIAAEKEYLSK